MNANIKIKFGIFPLPGFHWKKFCDTSWLLCGVESQRISEYKTWSQKQLGLKE